MNKRGAIGMVKRVIFFLFVLAGLYACFYFLMGGTGRKNTGNTIHRTPGTPLFFAHRGISAYFPENSMAGLSAAGEAGFKAVEIDIRKSADDQFIVFHDADANRLLGLDSMACAMTVASIKRHPLLFRDSLSTSHVMTLEETLDSFKNEFVFYLDIKIRGNKVADELVQIIHKHKLERSVIVASTSIFFTGYIEYLYPDINTSLEGFGSGDEWWYAVTPRKLKPDFYSGFIQNVDEKHMDWIVRHDLSSSRVVYGVDHTNFESAMRLGLQNMILDYDTSNVALRKMLH